MSLNHLPNDILLQIVSWVGTDVWSEGYITKRGPRGLYCLMQCSHQLKELCIPKLYSTFRQENSQATKQFLLQILDKPELAAMVKTYSGACQEPGAKIGATSHEMKQYCQALQKLNLTEAASPNWQSLLTALHTQQWDAIADGDPSQVWSGWVQSLQNQEWDALTALLLTQLPKLETIHMSSYSSIDTQSRYLDFVLNHARLTQRNRHAGFLDHVNHVSIAYWDTEGGLDFEKIIPYLRLKSMETAYFHMISENEDFEIENYSGDSFDRLKSLSFNHSNIEMGKLQDFISLCPNMTHFCYVHGGSTVGWLEMVPQRFLSILMPFKDKLEKLELRNDDMYEVSGDEDALPLGSLKGFERLRELVIDSRALLGDWSDMDSPIVDSDDDEDPLPQRRKLIEVLPKNLEVLKLCWCEDGILESVEELLKLREDLVPWLKTMHLKYCTDNSDERAKKQALSDTYGGAGFDFQISGRLY